ncbi:CDP-glycerol glycerophosphotransferase family protein [Bacillus sp. Sa1BUA2]|uniref:CDP-glycerol glycerophosphotransferase family protein n=1 Tax=Bacillus norwichensis TaxID=2762217 RepID=A0ABR8VHN7_9BACI|nr:CDP-glycerol glycerophosphotransferase family protein [Bacillus norwichensis]
MAREVAIQLYLFVFRFFFTIFSICPQKKKTTFVASFGDNVLFTLKELKKQTDEKIVVLKTDSCRVNFDGIELNFELRHFWGWIRSIYHLATSNMIFIDNYFGFLASVKFKPNVKCIQLWHAAGAIKQFGLKDPSNAGRSPKAIERFKRVYSKFDYVVVGGERMADIYRESFGIREENILRTGIPRTDFFFEEQALQKTVAALKKTYPIIQEKKVILYAPTYREGDFNITSLPLNIDYMYRELKDEYILLLRLHPAVHYDFANQYPDFVYDVSDYPDINHLLVVTDLLISDYSSIPFEFSLLQRPMIFFAYDLEEYGKSRGFWEPYEQLVPGPVVYNSKELVEAIQTNKYNYDQIVKFANEWNEFSTGTSSIRLIQAIYSKNKSAETISRG